MNSTVTRAMGGLLLALVAGCWLLGCSSTPKVDWNSRIGYYTFDQAVVDSGPPDRETKLSDGSRVAEWLVRRGASSSVGFGVGGFSSGGVGVGVGQSIGSGRRNDYLQLTFDPAGKLSQWKRVTR